MEFHIVSASPAPSSDRAAVPGFKLDYQYVDSDTRPELRIAGLKPMYFDGTMTRTRRWMAIQHKDGRLYEPSFCAAVIELVTRLQPRFIFDVGAFLGYFTIMSAAASSEDTVIYSFEMNSDNYKLICANIVANGHLGASRMVPICAGVSDRSAHAQTITIRGFQMFEGSGAALDLSKVNNRDFSAASESIVDFVAIDDFCERHNVTPDLVKIDVEGWECRAFPGARRLIQRTHPTMLIELHADKKLQEFDMDQRRFIKSVAAEGYEICLFGDHKQRSGKGAPFLAHLSSADIDNYVEAQNTAIIAITPDKLGKLNSIIVRT
jgi:FkbM family methyltransferase